MIDSMTRPGTNVTAGLIEDMEREDDERGPEPDESELRVLRVLIPSVTARQPAAPRGSSGLQCDQCGGWFGVSFWTCSACAASALLMSEAAR